MHGLSSSRAPADMGVLSAVKQRMRSVKNIQKITSAMKMVAASKMRVAQSLTEKSRGLVQPFVSLIGDHPGGLRRPLQPRMLSACCTCGSLLKQVGNAAACDISCATGCRR